MYSRFMFALRFPSLVLSAMLQFLPIVRVALPATETAANFAAIIFRWGAGAAAVLGSVQAVSGASTVITTGNITATNGVSTSTRLLTSPETAGWWSASGTPPGVNLTQSGSRWYLNGTPAAVGVYPVGLVAKSSASANSKETTSKTITFTVVAGGGGGNSPPVANAQSVTTAEDSARSITLGGSDPDGDALTYAILGQPSHGALSGAAPNVTYTPAANYNGPDSFTFRVNDGTVNSASATVSITVTAVNDVPTANAQSVTIAEGSAKSITLTGSDVDGDSLTFAIVGSPSHGSLTGTAPNVTYTPAANYSGSDSFTFRVNDGSANSATATVSIDVTPVNNAPLATGQSVTTAEDTAKSITLTGTDADGDPLTYAIVGQPSHGSLSGTAPNVTYTPSANFNGGDSFTFRVNDGTVNSSQATVSINVTPVNDAPAASAQSVATPEDVAKAITLTGTDPDGDALSYSITAAPSHGSLSGTPPGITYAPAANFNGGDSFMFRVNDGTVNSPSATVSINVTAVNDAPTADAQNVSTPENTPRAITLTGSDVEGSALTYSVVSQPAHGSLSGTVPNLTYTPAAAYSGADSFTFKVNDGSLNSAVATVSISVSSVNSAPVANTLAVTTAEDTAKPITLTGSDANGDPLSFTVLTQPAKGTLGGTAPNLTYTPDANVNGPDSFTFKVNDGTVDSSPATVTISITAVNDAPVADNQSVTTAEDTPKGILLSGSDVEGSTLTYSIAGQPAHGTLSGSAPNLSYTPAANYNGADSFAFRVNDGIQDSALATVTIDVTAVNDAPIANAQSVSTPEDTSRSITLSGSDVEGSVLIYTVVSQPVHGSLNGSAPDLSYTPSTGYTGSDSLTFRVNDGSADSAVATVSINVSAVNNAPSATAQSVTIAEDTGKAITLSGSDPDGDPLSYSIVGQPAHGSLNGVAPNVNYAPAANYHGSDSFSFKVNDGSVDSAPATVSITVTPVNDPPVALSYTNGTPVAPGGQIVLSPLTGSLDPDGDALGIVSVSPTNGTAVIQGATILFTPTPNFAGTAYVGYTISDGQLDSSGLITVIISAASYDQFTIAEGPFVLNPQTGLIMQQVSVTNIGSSTVAAVRLTVSGLRSGVALHNASGNNVGQPSVQFNSPLNPGQGVPFMLEYYVPDRMPFTNALAADAVIPEVNSANPDNAIAISRAFLDRSSPGGPYFTIEFASVPGRTYTVIYSDNATQWKVATPSVTASASVTQWQDNGPPKTVSQPGSGSRLYRIISTP